MRALIRLLIVLAATPCLSCNRQPQAAPQDSAAKPAELARPSDGAKPAQPPTVAAPQLVEVVPDLPDFPSAVMTSQAEKGPGEGWTKSWKRETRVTAPYPDVRTFYLEQFEKKGWTIASTKEKATEVKWGLSKGTSWSKVEIDVKASGMVKIRLERKER
jgi:hypothetical protein